jgi:hypothetical protein
MDACVGLGEMSNIESCEVTAFTGGNRKISVKVEKLEEKEK